MFIVHRTKSAVKLGEELDESNPYMKCGRNRMINDEVRMSTRAKRQYCLSSSDKMGESLMEAIDLYKIWEKTGSSVHKRLPVIQVV